jgi:hypothetical protein
MAIVREDTKISEEGLHLCVDSNLDWEGDGTVQRFAYLIARFIVASTVISWLHYERNRGQFRTCAVLLPAVR